MRELAHNGAHQHHPGPGGVRMGHHPGPRRRLLPLHLLATDRSQGEHHATSPLRLRVCVLGWFAVFRDIFFHFCIFFWGFDIGGVLIWVRFCGFGGDLVVFL